MISISHTHSDETQASNPLKSLYYSIGASRNQDSWRRPAEHTWPLIIHLEECAVLLRRRLKDIIKRI